MPQYTINTGIAANDGLGDPLRTAFIKTDENFDQIWAAGPVGSNITVLNNTIAVGNTNGNLVLQPNGIGVIRTAGSLQPAAGNSYNIGSSSLRYRSGWFGVGGVNVAGDVTISGNLTAARINYTANVFVGDLQGSVFADDSTIMVDAIDNIVSADTGIFTALTAGNVTGSYFIGNGSQLTGITSSYDDANVEALMNTGLTANIIPAANITYSLGNSTRQWSELWVANSTIYLGGVALGITGNTLTVNGEAVLSNDSDTTIVTTGNVTANYFLGNGSQLTGISAGTGNITFSDTTISAPDDESMTLQVSDGDQAVRSSLLLDSNDGLTRWSSLSSEQETSYNTGDWSTATWTGNSLNFVDAPNIVAFVDTGDYNNSVNRTFSINGGPRLPYDGASYGGNNISFSTTVAADPDPTTVTTISFYYQFQSQIQMDHDDEEILIQARGMDITIDGDDDIDIQAADNIDIQASGSIDIDADEQIDIRSYSITDPVRIITDDNNSSYTWEFGATGNLTLPAGGFLDVGGGIVARTGASPAPYLSGFSSLSTAGAGGNISASGNLVATANVFGSYGIFTGNITGGNIITGNGANIVLGNSNSYIKQNASNATINLSGSVRLVPDTSASATNGVIIGGSGYLLSSNGSRNAVLNYGSSSGTMGIYTVNIYGNQATAITNGGSNGVGNIGANASNRFNTAFLTDVDASGNITGNTAGYAIGYRDIPQVSFTGNATIATTDAGKHFYSTQSTDYILTIANNASQGFQVGAAITVVNQGTGNITIAQGSGVTLYLAGNASSGNRTVSTFGMATIMKVATDTWFISGAGVA